MANCPNCGSNHIQLTNKTIVNWGRALVGYAFLGVVGGAIGSLTGEDRQIIVCLECGCNWNATQVFDLKELIKRELDVLIDLTHELDRSFFNDLAEKLPDYMSEFKDTWQKLEQKSMQRSLEVERGKLEAKIRLWSQIYQLAFKHGIVQ